VEVSFSHKENTITLAEWAHEKTYKLNIPKGNYRLRYSIKNMEKEYTENDDYTSPLDDQQYLIEIWPNDNNHIQDSIIKVTSDIAQYCHKTVTKEVKIQSSVEITVRKNGRFTCPQCNWSLVFIEAYKHCRNCGIEHILTNKTIPTKTYDSLLNTEIMSILPIASSVTPDNLWDTEGSEMHCLYLAVINKDKELINDFIAKGLDPNHTDTSGNTLLHTVIENSEKHDVIKFVVELNVNLNTLNNRNWSSLFLLRKTFTASKRNKELHQWLQEHGAKATPDLFKTAWK